MTEVGDDVWLERAFEVDGEPLPNGQNVRRLRRGRQESPTSSIVGLPHLVPRIELTR